MALDVSPDGKTIAFDLLGNLFTLPISGGRAHQLTEGPAFNERPQFTPDGRFLVYTSDRGGTDELWRIPVTGGNPQRLPPQEAAKFHLAWGSGEKGGIASGEGLVYPAPGGRYSIKKYNGLINANRMPSDGTGPRACSMSHFMLTDETANTTRRLAAAGSDCGSTIITPSAFTPDGGAFITSYGGKIWRIGIPDGETREIPFRASVELKIRPLKRFPVRVSEEPQVHARRIAGATVSPDGKHVAFSAFSRLWVAELTGESAPKRLTSSSVGEFWPTWSPDGQYLAFATWTESGDWDGAIYRMRADGRSAPQRLTREPGLYAGLAYSKDGNQLFALRVPAAQLLRPKELKDNSRLSATDYEVISIAANGDATHSLFAQKAGTFASWSSRLQAVDGETERTAQFEQYSVEIENAMPESGGRLRGFARGASPETLLIVVLPDTDMWPDLDGITDIVLSPLRRQALIVLNHRDLFLVDIPPGDGSGTPRIVFNPNSAEARRITPISSGAEFPQWQRNGKSFTYSFGSTLYKVDVSESGQVSEPREFKLDVTLPRDRPKGTLVLRNARLITMRGDEVIERGDLIIRDRRIVAVGRSGSVSIPADGQVVDLSGKTIIPGLVDLHNHIEPLWGITRSRVPSFEINLAYGVLTSLDVQSMGGVPILSYIDQMDIGEILAPRYFTTGPGIPTPSSDVISSLEDARQVMARYADVYGVRHIKEYDLRRGGRAARQWLVMAADERGMTVTTHRYGQIRNLLQNAIDGYRAYEHVTFDGEPFRRDVRQLLAASELTLANGVSVEISALGTEWLSEEERALAKSVYPPKMYDGLSPYLARGRSSSFAYVNPIVAQDFARVAADGGRVGVGAHGNVPGLGTHVFMWGLAAGGMTSLEALRAATLNGAESLGLEQDLGSLEVGKLGDILILEKNPLESIRNSCLIHSVVFNGRLRDAATLNELWPQKRAVPRAWWFAE